MSTKLSPVQVAQLAGIPLSVIDLAQEKGSDLEEKLKASSMATPLV